jgi:cytochrome c553
MSKLFRPQNNLRTILLAALIFLQLPAFAEDNSANGEVIFADKCAVCHGAFGEVSNEVIPNILGQYPAYLLSQMQAFLSDDPKSARRGVAGSLKRSILLELSVQDIQDIVAYLGTVQYKVVGASKEEAEEIKGKLEGAGATIELK